MPGYDRTGPRGMSPRTGRGLGPCGLGGGRGYGMGFGRGFGYGYREPTKEEQKRMLEREVEDTELYLKDLKEELKNFE